jgi:predicted dehydrogenase
MSTTDLTPLPVALVGAGGYGQTHLRLITELAQHGLLRLDAVCDTVPERGGDRLAAAMAHGVRFYPALESLLEREPQIELVTIATPIPLHERMARVVLAAGRHLLLEKPPVPTLRQLRDLITLAAERGRHVAVGFGRIHAAATQEAKRRLVAGEIGRPLRAKGLCCWPRTAAYYARSPWAGRQCLDGEPVRDGPAMNATSHTLHLLLYLAGSQHEAFARPIQVRGEFYRAKPIEGDDTVCLRAQTDTGCGVSFWTTHACPPPQFDRLLVEGESGTLTWTPTGLRLERIGQETEEIVLTPEPTGGHYRDLVAVLRGDADRVTVALEDTRSFLETYELALASSGGIHPVSDADRVRGGEGSEENWVIHDIVSTAERAFAENRCFGDLALPWAVTTRWLSSNDGPIGDGPPR